MHTLAHDLRYAGRMLGRSPGFAIVAVLTLALGIGANTAIFSVVNALLLRPLPYAEPDRLVMVWQDLTAQGGPKTEWATPANFVEWRDSGTVFLSVAAVQGWQPALTGIAEAEPLVGEQVTRDYFDVLGVLPALGRSFHPDEDVPNANRVAILSHSLWQRRFGGDPAVIGRSIMLGAEPHEVVGVMPPTFRPAVIAGAEVWRPRRLNTATPSRGAVVLRIVARLKPGLTLDRASTTAAVLAAQLERAHPETNTGAGINIVPLHEQIVGQIKTGLLVLLGAVGFVLLIACVNIANLLLARASGRSREIAVRMALGADRGRVVRQLLTESVVLAGIGGACGVLLGLWGVSALVSIAPAGAPRLDEIGLDGTVLAFAVLLTLATGILFGLVPALQSSRSDFTPALREGGRGSAGPAGQRTRRALIVVEVAIALVLLVGSGLLMRTFLRLQATDLGFDPRGVLTGVVVPPAAKYQQGDQQVALYDRLLERTAALPGVAKAALTSVIPLGGDSDMDFQIEGRPAPRDNTESTVTWYRLVSAGYLDAMGIRLREGRGFEVRETAPSVIVSETSARRYWPGRSALGARVRFGDSSPWFTVIGVAGDVKFGGARGAPRAEMYLPYWQFPERGINIVLKAHGDPGLLSGPLRQAVREIDPDLPVAGLQTMGEAVGDSISQSRFFALLVGVFAVLALTLAAIGIYGVMSYVVAQRTAEIGVRMALGAGRREVFSLVVGEGLKLAAAGVLAGFVTALVVTRSISSLLFGVEAQDPLTFGLTVATLLGVAALASIIPAHRATRVDPMTALRTE